MKVSIEIDNKSIQKKYSANPVLPNTTCNIKSYKLARYTSQLSTCAMCLGPVTFWSKYEVPMGQFGFENYDTQITVQIKKNYEVNHLQVFYYHCPNFQPLWAIFDIYADICLPVTL